MVTRKELLKKIKIEKRKALREALVRKKQKELQQLKRKVMLLSLGNKTILLRAMAKSTEGLQRTARREFQKEKRRIVRRGRR